MSFGLQLPGLQTLHGNTCVSPLQTWTKNRIYPDTYLIVIYYPAPSSGGMQEICESWLATLTPLHFVRGCSENHASAHRPASSGSVPHFIIAAEQALMAVL